MSKKTKSEAFAPVLPARASWILIFVGFLLVVHIVVPLQYYTSDSPDARADERFRWRMFSTVRMRKCSLQMREFRKAANGATFWVDLPLPRYVQMAWYKLMKRGRPQVAKQFLRKRCEQKNNQKLRLDQYCRDADGKPLFVLERALDCKTGKFSLERRSLQKKS